jgi:hypothetical protein
MNQNFKPILNVGSRRKLDYNIEVNLTEMLCETVEWIRLA